MTAGFPVDGHVHFHRLDAVERTLHCAADNMTSIGGQNSGLIGALLLAQTSRERVFERLYTLTQVGKWQIESVADEPVTIVVRDHRGRALALVNGRQVRAAGGLEVLALGTCREFRDGQPFEDAVDDVRASGAVTVLPWGFGKWLGERGRRVRAVLDALDPGDVLLGDNGGRWQTWPEPRMFRKYRERGFRILPGTDPFPFGADESRVGSCGACVGFVPTAEAPWRMLKRAFADPAADWMRYGSGVGLGRFVANNVGIQLRNRWASSEQLE